MNKHHSKVDEELSIEELEDERDRLQASKEWEYSDLAWNRLRHLQATIRNRYVKKMLSKGRDE